MMTGRPGRPPPDRERTTSMDITISMRELIEGRWVASVDGDLAVEASGATRDECLQRVRASIRQVLPEERRDEPLTLIVQIVPVLAGVAEAARVMGWDKRRVITYIDRGRFPEPVQALAAGRVWIRSDVQRFAEEWRARQRTRKLRQRPREAPDQPEPAPEATA
jgi:hypothetical protein